MLSSLIFNDEGKASQSLLYRSDVMTPYSLFILYTNKSFSFLEITGSIFLQKNAPLLMMSSYSSSLSVRGEPTWFLPSAFLVQLIYLNECFSIFNSDM